MKTAEMKNRKSLPELQKQVDDFNAKYNIGALVHISTSENTHKDCTVKAPASILGGHSAVGWFNEITGCYSLDKVIF